MIRILALLFLFVFSAPAFAQDENWETELIYRTTLGTPADVKFLVDKVGNPDLTDEMGYPLLYIAASRNDAQALDVVKTLVEAGADINYDGGLGNYPLIAAVQSDNTEIVRYLLDHDADYRASDSFGITLLDYARQSGRDEIRQMIESAVQKDITERIGGRTQRALDELTYDLAYHSCAFQYYAYYYASGQDDIPKAEQEETLKKHQSVISKNMGYLRAKFRVSADEVKDIFFSGKQAIFTEMEEMISNRWRRQQGVGKPGDMEKRCAKHAEPYKDGYFDKSVLDEIY